MEQINLFDRVGKLQVSLKLTCWVVLLACTVTLFLAGLNRDLGGDIFQVTSLVTALLLLLTFGFHAIWKTHIVSWLPGTIALTVTLVIAFIIKIWLLGLFLVIALVAMAFLAVYHKE